VAILEAARNSARNDAEKVNILQALLISHSEDDYAKGIAIGEELARQFPESERLFYRRAFLLRALGRYDEAERFAEERLKRLPGDETAMRVQVYIAAGRKDYVKAHALVQGIIDEGKAGPQDLNSIAWLSLFTGKVESADLENALKGAELSKNAPGILHTLGCVYAEVGKTKQAREVLIQAMDALNLDEPDENYWYAFGRIAEQYGEREVALANYARVTKPKKEYQLAESSYQLAQIRLELLRANQH
jgi:tetratricopeptide (TPR) repeat protein